jgi:hypothetical protein
MIKLNTQTEKTKLKTTDEDRRGSVREFCWPEQLFTTNSTKKGKIRASASETEFDFCVMPAIVCDRRGAAKRGL